MRSHQRGELRAFVAPNVAAATKGLQNPTVERDNLSMKLAFPIAAKR